MKKLHKILAAVLVMLMLAAMLPVSASGTRTSAPLTEAQKTAKLSKLMDFNSRLVETASRFPSPQEVRGDDPYALCRIIVKYHGRLDTRGALASVSGYNDWNVLWYSSPEEARKAAEAFRKTRGVEWAEPDILMSVCASPGSSSFKSWGFGASYVNAFNMNEWLYAKYGSNMSNFPEVIVAVVDTGCDQSHPFLAGRTVQGYDVYDDDFTPTDNHSHGTHVSGTIVDGTLPNVKVMPVKVLGDDGYGSNLSVSLGMEYAYLHGAHVENCSLGGLCDADDGEGHNMMAEVINAAFDNGTTVCVAAGNDSVDAIDFCPANIARACTVSATTSSNGLAYFSNYGEIVDVAAPGDSIYSSVPGGSFEYKSGTSMASPHVAAVAAMIKSVDPDMSADAVVEIIKGSAKSVSFTNAGTGLACVTDLFKYDLYVNAEGGALHFTSSGNYPWAIENGVAASGNTGVNSSSSSLTCKPVVGELVSVTFDYKVSSESNADYLRLKVNGAQVFETSGERDWQTATVAIDAENPTLVWEFSKNASGASGSDRAWIRNVRVSRSLTEAVNLFPGEVPFVSVGNYPWIDDLPAGAAKSGNAGADGTSSVMTTSVTLIKGMKIRFDYKVSSAAGDKLTVKINEQDVLVSGSTDGFIRFSWIAPRSGDYDLKFIYSKNASGSAGSDCAWIRNFCFHHTFVSVINGSEQHLPFDNNNEEFPWIAKHDYAMSSNLQEDSSESFFTLTLDLQAGETLTFQYSVSSEANYDKFHFFVDGVEKVTESGEIAWREYTFTAASSKTYEFKWSYTKDSSVDRYEDCAKVKNVLYSGTIPAPTPNGDANSDGVVDGADALLILRWSMGLVDEADIDLVMSDIDGSGVVDATDALIVLRLAIGLRRL